MVAKSVGSGHKTLSLSQRKRLSLSWNNWTVLKAISWTFGRYDRQTKRGGVPVFYSTLKSLEKPPAVNRSRLNKMKATLNPREGTRKEKIKTLSQAFPSYQLMTTPTHTSLVRSMLGRKRVHQTRNVNIAQRNEGKTEPQTWNVDAQLYSLSPGKNYTARSVKVLRSLKTSTEAEFVRVWPALIIG